MSPGGRYPLRVRVSHISEDTPMGMVDVIVNNLVQGFKQSFLMAYEAGGATPTAIIFGTGLGAQHGILFKNVTALETAARIQTVAMDKTGTLIKGEPEVTEVNTDGIEETELLRLCRLWSARASISSRRRPCNRPTPRRLLPSQPRNLRTSPATVRWRRSTAVGPGSATVV